MFDILFDKIVDWINKQEDMYIKRDINDLKKHFLFFLYAKNINVLDDEKYLYFSLKYTSDIIDLNSELREITKGYCSKLFHTREEILNGSLNLLNFIYNNIIYDYNDTIDEEENTINEYYE